MRWTGGSMRWVLGLTGTVALIPLNGAAQPTEPAVTVAAAPDLVIGTEGDPRYEFHNVRGVAALPDRRVAVVDWGSAEVRFYSADGSFLEAVGGAGDGPSELRTPALLPAARYDSLLLQHGFSRIKSVGPDGRVETVAEFSQPEWPVGATPAGILFSALGGSVVDGATRGPNESWIHFYIRGSQGALVGPRIERSYYRTYAASATAGSVVPLTRTPMAAAGTDGFWITSGVDAVVEEYDLSQGLRREILLPLEEGPVDRSEFEDSIRGRIRGAHSDAFRRAYRDMPPPGRQPLVDALVPDAAGGVWVLTRGPTDHPRRWLVVRDGAVLGWVETPAGLDVQYVGRDHILGVTRDAHGVERVERRRITRHPR